MAADRKGRQSKAPEQVAVNTTTQDASGKNSARPPLRARAGERDYACAKPFPPKVVALHLFRVEEVSTERADCV